MENHNQILDNWVDRVLVKVGIVTLVKNDIENDNFEVVSWVRFTSNLDLGSPNWGV